MGNLLMFLGGRFKAHFSQKNVCGRLGIERLFHILASSMPSETKLIIIVVLETSFLKMR